MPSAVNVRKSGCEEIGELAALITAQGPLQNRVVHPDETRRGTSPGDCGVGNASARPMPTCDR